MAIVVVVVAAVARFDVEVDLEAAEVASRRAVRGDAARSVSGKCGDECDRFDETK